MDLAHVAKTYRGRVQALRGITMQVRAGEVFGLLGPNGAGKSTLVKILMTVIRASRCDGTMLGRPVGDKATLREVGYLPEHHRFNEYLTGAQVLDYYGALSEVPRRIRRARAAELMDLVGMKDWAHKKVRSYSKGMRQRVGIAQALMNDPRLVLLDEPTDGVDPVGRKDIREMLLRLKDDGKTVFINSHLLSELEIVSDRVAILVQGTVSAIGTIAELTRGQEYYVFEVELPDRQDPMTLLPTSMLKMAPVPAAPGGAGDIATVSRGQLASGIGVELDGSRIKVHTVDARAVQPVIDAFRSRGVVIKEVRFVRPSLEDLFMKAVADPITGDVLKPGAKSVKRSTP